MAGQRVARLASDVSEAMLVGKDGKWQGKKH